MTALTEYDRLEATGLWRARPEAQRVEVIVSIGEATLTIADRNERALAHWSLPAVHRLNPTKRPALYAPSEEADEVESLEIDDDDMIAAIEKVRRAIARRRPRQGRLRVVLTATGGLALLALAAFWLPAKITDQTVSLLPDATRKAVGDRMLSRVRQFAGEPCIQAAGRTALAKLGRRVLGEVPGRIFVVPSGVETSAHLPGGVILINRRLVEDAAEPDVPAGFIIAERLRAETQDPMRDLLDHAGLFATVRMLTSGQVSDEVLDDYAQALLTAPPRPVDDKALLARFDEMAVRATPYALTLDPDGDTTRALIEADPVPISEASPLIPDADWVAIQGICTN
ncbi:hypothetical protein [Maritimibacter sp. DP1N21-5]|uniref:hypothetical protein n=1 Tax=Maritimibacter sp. DP1N21-5 TaxID=2836867 RepID=UPI001C484877|nr:hypothetical protein [Maritimibacter sp. DP1N21-5]MBV7409204.1 hypothetical protein [Maritimibacter sp. DP1N21-5]